MPEPRGIFTKNSPLLPVGSLVVAALFAVGAVIAIATRVGRYPISLSEIEIGFTAAAFALLIFGLQGLLSIVVEGEELRPGRSGPRLTDPLSLAITVFSVILFVLAVALATGIVSNWSHRALGLLAGFGCLDLALLLVAYKEAFLGEEARFDEREDGVPW